MSILGTLTSEQIRLFRHNGFLKLEERLPEETVTELKATICHARHTHLTKT